MTIRTEKIEIKFDKVLTKDLQENEEICEACGGLGLQIHNNEYGLRKEGERINPSNLFPYKKQTLGSCFHCYNGVRKRCEFCLELTPDTLQIVNAKSLKSHVGNLIGKLSEIVGTKQQK